MYVVWTENVIAPLPVSFFFLFLSVGGIGIWGNLRSVGDDLSHFLQETEGIVWRNILVAGHKSGTCSRLSWAQLPPVPALIFV